MFKSFKEPYNKIIEQNDELNIVYVDDMNIEPSHELDRFMN
jgi:hypothetical protein